MKKNKKWYSVVLATMMVWFMLILTFWVFWLILRESKDTKMMENYLKSYQAAEWGIELALLETKLNNYYIDKNIDNTHPLSKIFKSWDTFNSLKDPILNYQVNSQAQSIVDKKIWIWKYHIIPLQNVKKLRLESNIRNDLVWNIVWEKNWITWTWNIWINTNWNYKTIDNNWNINYTNMNVYDYLKNNTQQNYLILNNVNQTQEIKYSITSWEAGEKFITDETEVLSSAEIKWFKQNLRVIIKNQEYLNLLKYSIYSPD